VRIVAGESRGRRIAAPPGRAVRPTPERVREAVFSSLGDAVRGARALDLFAGSGAMGLEALSRGALSTLFVERSAAAARVVERNIEALGYAGRARLIRGDALAAVASLSRSGEVFDLAFLDPPYAGDLLARALAAIEGSGLLAPGAVLVAEHGAGSEIAAPGSLRIERSRGYGDTSVTVMIAPSREDDARRDNQ